MPRPAPALSCRPDPATPWFRSSEGRRYLRHFGGLIALKILLLTALYFAVVAPQPRADTSPGHVFDAIGRPAAAAPSTANPPNASQTRSENTP